MIIYKTKEEIAKIREGGQILAKILDQIGKEVKPGVDTVYLEEMACRLIEEAGGRPSFKGYKSGGKPFPTALCTSVNNEVVHTPAIPGRVLDSGDIIGIDIGMEYPSRKGEKGFYTDMAVTIAVGKVSEQAKKLIRVTRECLDSAIKQMKPKNTLNDIARAVQTHAEKNGFSVVRDLVGHGVGKAVHEAPNVPNFVVDKGFDIVLEPGMVLAIEPMINMGAPEIKTGKDGFSIVTADGKLSAHFEHTVAITEDGHEVLTQLSI